MQRLVYLFMAILMLGTLGSCRRNNNGIPLVVVDKQININNPGYFNIQATGGWMYLSGGSQGLIIYRKNVDEFRVYDRHSPYLPENNCQVSVDTSDNITAEDPCSGSKFLITDGSVVNGPASFPLKQYQTSFDGTILRIYN